MNVNNVFPSRYIKSEDLGDKRFILTIKDVQMEDLGEDTKPVIYFTKSEKGLACNKTNFFIIASMYGDETDDWTGKRITLYAGWTRYQGKRVRGLMVEEEIPGEATNGHAKPTNGNGHARPSGRAPLPNGHRAPAAVAEDMRAAHERELDYEAEQGDEPPF